MKRHYQIIVTAFLVLALGGLFALGGCDSGQKANESNEKTTETTKVDQHEAVELQIFAANSLSKALVEVQELYTKDHAWVTFADTQFEASGTLVESLKAGSHADLLITASKATMDTAEESKLVNPSTRFDMFSNELVIITQEKSSTSKVTLQDIAAGTYTLAVGDESVPAGNYACQALSTVGAYKDPSGEKGSKITGKGGAFEGINPARESSVGNVCKKVEAGEVDVGIVYSSDVYRYGGVKIVGTIPDTAHKAIVYPAAGCSDSKKSEEVRVFLDWATTDPAAIKIWQAWGFELVS